MAEPNTKALSARDQELLAVAMELALKGRGQVEPNPRVGALVLKNGVVVGRGYHRAWGGLHAEAEALADAQRSGGVSDPDEIVVTLEPCSAKPGQGGKRQPPCLDTILGTSIRRVVIGSVDPDPRHGGRAMDRLLDAGIEVAAAPSHCDSINEPFRRWLSLDRPWTIAKWAMSLDGKIATQARTTGWLSNPESRRRVHELRSRVDGIVVGFRTACVDDPSLTVREGFDAGLAVEDAPRRVVIDPLAELPIDLGLVRDAANPSTPPTLIVTRDDADPGRVQVLRDHGVEVMQAPGLRSSPRALDLVRAWQSLRRERESGGFGMRRVLVEGGGGLFGALWRADLVDHAIAHLAPRMLGGQEAPTPFDAVGFDRVEDAPQFAEMWCEPASGVGTAPDDLRIHAMRGETAPR